VPGRHDEIPAGASIVISHGCLAFLTNHIVRDTPDYREIPV
jgi:hypothetical protein